MRLAKAEKRFNKCSLLQKDLVELQKLTEALPTVSDLEDEILYVGKPLHIDPVKLGGVTQYPMLWYFILNVDHKNRPIRCVIIVYRRIIDDDLNLTPTSVLLAFDVLHATKPSGGSILVCWERCMCGATEG